MLTLEKRNKRKEEEVGVISEPDSSKNDDGATEEIRELEASLTKIRGQRIMILSCSQMLSPGTLFWHFLCIHFWLICLCIPFVTYSVHLGKA